MEAAKTIKLSEMNNVDQLHDYRVYDDFVSYLVELETFSKNTRNGYERDIKDFFEIYLNKDMRYLKEEDLMIEKKDILLFRQSLIKKIYANATINRKIRALKSFYDTLKSFGYKVDPTVFNKIRELPKTSKSHGILTPDEAFALAEIALTTERQHKLIKYYLIHTAIRSSLRKSDLLSLTWNDFTLQDDIVIINTLEKKTSKDADRPLTREFYNELLSLKTEGVDRVFNISKDAIDNMMPRILGVMKMPKERNIKFHSFRSVGIDFVLDVTNDIKAAAAQGNHSNINTTYQSYIRKNKNYDNMAGILMDRKLDKNILNDLSKEELIVLIDKLKYTSKYELLKLAHELNGNVGKC